MITTTIIDLAGDTDWHTYYGALGHTNYGSHNALDVWLAEIATLKAEPREFFAASFYDAWTTDNVTYRYWWELLTLEQDGVLMPLADQLPLPPPTPTGTWTVYRGASAPDHDGMSWTLNRDKAMWFARRLDGTGFLMETTIEPFQVLGYTDERQEQEVILWPEASANLDPTITPVC